MIKSKKLITFIIVLLGVFFLTNNFFNKEPEDLILEKKVMIKTIKKLKKEKNLFCIGFGGFGKEKIKISSLSFTHGEPCNIDKARELLVYAIELFLNEFNSFKKIHPYLENYPFTNKNVEVRIFFENKKRNTISSYISVVSLTRGKIFYKIDENNSLITVYEEPYERALNFIKRKNHS
ncbi:MAG: hypothetical protein AMS24_02190 [Chlamydiae bacterium SM23_39]|nr:MAG: hypothetical protein AMS24_02190 [Chlamydiae bacterium SM23_39]